MTLPPVPPVPPVPSDPALAFDVFCQIALNFQLPLLVVGLALVLPLLIPTRKL